MNKEALNPNDIWEGVKSATGNPLIRSGLLGAGTYLASRYAYDTMADRMANSNFESIQDPAQRQMAWEDYQRRKDRVRPWLTGGATALAMSLPFLGKGKVLHQALQGGSLADPASWGNPLRKMWAVGTQDNPIPAMNEIDKISSYIQYSPAMGDLGLGKEFVLPAVRPMTFIDDRDIPKAQSIDLLNTQLPILGLDNTIMLGGALHNSGEGRSGMISTRDIIQGLMGAGFGAAAGWAAGNVMGTIFAQDPAVKSKMGHYGAIGGAILNSIPFISSKM